jgi:hypothetical protein
MVVALRMAIYYAGGTFPTPKKSRKAYTILVSHIVPINLQAVFLFVGFGGPTLFWFLCGTAHCVSMGSPFYAL